MKDPRVYEAGSGAVVRQSVFLLTLTVMLMVGLMTAFAACGSTKAGDTILTIDQALKAKPGQAVRVQGHLVATENQALLASALLESYPPQAGGTTLELESLDLEMLVGLSSTANQPDLAQVTWSDFPVVLEGIIRDGVLQVKKTPPVVETATDEVRVRFSPAAEPLMVSNVVWWVFDVTNLTSASLDVTFPTGQMGEVVFQRDGEELYRWSEGKSFLQGITVDTLPSGGKQAIVLNDRVVLAPGVYKVTAKVTASTGPEGSMKPLPEVLTTITVR